MSGSGTTLGLVGTGDYGTASGTGTVIYTDGTTEPFTLTFPDWWANTTPPGVPLQAGKTVKYVTLPDVSEGATQGQTAMHIFAIGIG